MADLDVEIATYKAMLNDLESKHKGEWVVIQGRMLHDACKTFDEAARSAVAAFGRGPFLIKQVGAPPVVLPASVMYRPGHAPR